MGSIYGPVYCPIVVTYSLLHTYPYIFNAMVGTEASLRRLLLVGIWGFLVLFLKKLLYRRIGFGFFFIRWVNKFFFSFFPSFFFS